MVRGNKKEGQGSPNGGNGLQGLDIFSLLYMKLKGGKIYGAVMTPGST